MAVSKRARKRILLLLVVAVVLVVGVGAAVQWRQASRATKLAEAREEGLALYEQGDWEGAMSRLSPVASANQSDAEALTALADSRQRVPLESGRHLASAISFAQQALIAEPSNVEALELLVELYQQVGQLTELINVAERLLAIDPEHHEALWARASGLTILGRRDGPDAIDAMLEAYPDDVRGHALRVQHMLGAGAGSEAVRAYADAEAEKRPTSAEFLLLQAEARARTSGPSDSLADLRLSPERAETLEINDPASLGRVVQLLDMVGQSDVADDLLERELSDKSSSDAVAIAVERDWKAGRVELARERARGAVEDIDTAEPALLGWTVLLVEEGEPRGADHPAYQELRLRNAPEARFWAHLIDGREALEKGEWGSARSSLESAIQSPAARAGGLAPLDIAEYLLGRAELALGAWREAASRWDRVASRNPSWVSVRLELADLALRNGLYRDSFNHAGRVLATHPNSYGAGKAAARAMVGMLEAGEVEIDSSDETVALMQELRRAAGEEDESELAQVLALEARTRLVRGELDLAQRAVDQLGAMETAAPAIDLLPLLERGERAGLSSLDQLASASAGDRDPRTAAAITTHEAQRLADLGRMDEARRLFTTAIERADDAARGEYERAYALWLDKRGEREGVERLRTLAEENRRSARAQIDLLNSQGAWVEPGVAEPAIEALRAVGGESSIAWRIYEARRLLTFEPSEAKAAQAVELLGPGLRAGSPDAAALALAGEAMMELGDRAAAVDYFGRALDADPRRSGLYPRLVTMLLADGRIDMARARQTEFARLVGVSGASLRRRAELSEALGMWGVAISDRRELATARGAGELERARLGSVLARAEQAEEADRVFDRLVSEPIEDPQALAIVADYLGARQRLDEALSVIGEASVDDSVRARLAAAQLAKHGRVDEAIERLNLAAEAEPSAPIYSDLARLHLQRGDARLAVEAIDAGLALDPDSTDLAALSASARMRAGDTGVSDALAELAAAAGEGDLAPGMNEIIEATRKVTEDGDLEAYIARLEGIAERTPASLLLSRLLAHAHLQAGNVERAINVASNAARVFASSPEAAKLAADILAQVGRMTEATAMVERWLEQSSARPNDAYEARLALARLMIAQDEPSDAAEALDPVRDRVLSEGERRPDRLDLYARALAGAGRVDDARAIFDGRLEDGNELWFRLFTSAAVALHRTPGAARAWLAEAESTARVHPALLEHAAQAWFDLAGITGEEEDFERVIALLESVQDVEETPAVMLLAVSLEQVGRLEESEARLRQAIETFGDQPVPLNNLAYLLVRRGGSAEEAVGLAERAVATARERRFPTAQIAGFLHTLGSAQAASGDAETAEATLRDGLSIAPDHKDLLLELAELQFASGRAADAIRTFGRINPDLDEPGADEAYRERYESLKTRLSQADP